MGGHYRNDWPLNGGDGVVLTGARLIPPMLRFEEFKIFAIRREDLTVSRVPLLEAAHWTRWD
ncbi:hypothetical protein B7486_05120 [cyanobacterium TDX16]|nr:hypothetical protein B7486_05120 [cyanobacterium TDX16]